MMGRLFKEVCETVGALSLKAESVYDRIYFGFLFDNRFEIIGYDLKGSSGGYVYG